MEFIAGSDIKVFSNSGVEFWQQYTGRGRGRLCQNPAHGAPRLLFDNPTSGIRIEVVSGPYRLGGLGAQPALVIALAERHAARAQDVVCGDGVEMEVGQREREDEGLRREGEPPRADLKVQVLARPAVDLIGGERLQRRFRLGDHGL